MDKISIVTRAYNRLEYTIRCIRSVRENTVYDNYEHIIVNNNSSDGTKEWLDWINNTKQPYFSKLRAIHLDENIGDWEGMKASFSSLGQDVGYIVQLDNDIEVDHGWLTALKFVLDNSPAQLVMCKRTGVGAVLKPTKIIEYKNEDKIYEVGYINKVVACFIAKYPDFKNIASKISGDGNKSVLGQKMRPCAKITNVFCHHREYHYDDGEKKALTYLRDTTWEKL